MSVPRARLLDLLKARCELFSTTFNPEGIRTGNKILRQRLKGPALASYYPPKLWSMRDFQDAFKDLHLLTDNEPELDRLDHIRRLKQRGKGASAGSAKNKKKKK
ncbi:mitochondrial ribosomal subunit S27-domain-containing protein [Podospora australis]|uniref:Small ribosomal subunit protein mS33 n=1 Tax=Podospora australis TaxID=1536484 RepID=A0AAN6X189_9PEZI|nr:mitochondrial ribosomal subunit S27-domain-containing protein [Podospora australis]